MTMPYYPIIMPYPAPTGSPSVEEAHTIIGIYILLWAIMLIMFAVRTVKWFIYIKHSTFVEYVFYWNDYVTALWIAWKIINTIILLIIGGHFISKLIF